jgi:hypothetical protein
VLTGKRVDYFSARIVGGTRNDKPIAILGFDPVGGKLRSKPILPDDISQKRIRLRGVRSTGSASTLPR